MTSKTSKPSLDVPETWGMYTRRGDVCISSKFRTLINKLDVNLGRNTNRHIANINSLTSFVYLFLKTQNNEDMSEAFDTDVRDQVWGFLRSVCNKYSIDENTLRYSWTAGERKYNNKG